MKNEIVIRLQLPRFGLGYRALIGAAILAVTAVSFAALPTFMDGTTLRAKDLTDLTNAVAALQSPTACQRRFDGINGYGSTNTNVPIFQNSFDPDCSDITDGSNSTDGAKFTINTPGIYAISFTGVLVSAAGAGSGYAGVALTVDAVSGLSNTNVAATVLVGNAVLAKAIGTVVDGSNYSGPQASWVGFLGAGRIVRPVTDSTTLSQAFFSIARVR